ncbi:hypothetical protein SAMN02927937_01286 [Paenimyroides aquimaris]|uniref:Uncharacterized protein n=1 Tax=Paenimyroides marinum TaxID=1159016 RepID=A0A1H6KKU5_9FLAO|nr:hypothetical protein [Paenimyroides aquimaris]SEH76271.1 hypothetical protein SAMN02927937_01286 [Paenimyroides aquimaris]
MKDRELNQAIEVLKSVKNAYESNKTKITREVLAMPLGYNQSINWSKVNKAIENSLDWDKVVELVKKTIPHKNVEKIKNINNLTQINEYKSLVNFLFEKLSYSQVNQVKYICYWKTISTAPPTSNRPTSVYTSTTNNSSDNANSVSWFYWVFGIIIFIMIVKACN